MVCILKSVLLNGVLCCNVLILKQPGAHGIHSIWCLSQGLLLCTDTMTKATLRTRFHWGWFTASEVQSITIRAGSMMLKEELRVLHLDQKAARRRLCPRQPGGGSQSPHPQ
ncbi:rCG24063 [Rattus norvegicus]|uniref:RCG24063 n=1 Tax=Rattus norvegicus TaxID=10116 RepID=A6JST9_RAT|nr:rCG24063 [Rattus norvegicus]